LYNCPKFGCMRSPVHWKLTSYREALQRAAQHYGIELSYFDTWGRLHEASEAALQSLLTALGVPAGTAEGLEAAIERDRAEAWSRPFDPVMVVRPDTGAIPLR